MSTDWLEDYAEKQHWPHAHCHAFGQIFERHPEAILWQLRGWWQREHKDQVLEWRSDGYDASLRTYLIYSEVIA